MDQDRDLIEEVLKNYYLLSGGVPANFVVRNEIISQQSRLNHLPKEKIDNIIDNLKREYLVKTVDNARDQIMQKGIKEFEMNNQRLDLVIENQKLRRKILEVYFKAQKTDDDSLEFITIMELAKRLNIIYGDNNLLAANQYLLEEDFIEPYLKLRDRYRITNIGIIQVEHGCPSLSDNL